jgi:ankyrin repeat protein
MTDSNDMMMIVIDARFWLKRHGLFFIILSIILLHFVDSFSSVSGIVHVSVISSSALKTTILHREPPVNETHVLMDKRPHEQRRSQPRKARRLNHSFQHLYRHDSVEYDDAFIALGSQVMTKPREYLRTFGGYSDDIISDMCIQFPPLQDLHVQRHIRPKMRFLKYTLLSYTFSTSSRGKKEAVPVALPWIPPQYFGSRLERTIAPHHAFLVHLSLPHGRFLFELRNSNGQILFLDFLQACRQDKSFIHLCNEWRKIYGYIQDPNYPSQTLDDSCTINLFMLQSFDTYFQRGILSAARNETTTTTTTFGPNGNQFISPSQMIYLLIRHGANAREKDVRDISLFHWAAGSGNLDGLQILVNMTLEGGLGEALQMKADRDGATLLHWAATGAEAKNFGCGGHLHVCRYLLNYFTEKKSSSQLNEQEIVNACTKDGNSVLMWAAWSGSLDVVKLLVRHRADVFIQNRNGCTVAHWAASGGNLDLCKYLHDILNVNFAVANFAGNTPLSHAMAYGRADVVQWLLHDVGVNDIGGKAMEMLQWTDNDGHGRTQNDLAMNLFGDYDFILKDHNEYSDPF